MTTQEYFELGKSHIEGENGFQKDMAKALEYLKSAANDGHKEAALLYAKHALEHDPASCVELLGKVIDEKAKADELDAYYTALTACAKKHPEKAGECKALAQKWIKAPDSTSRVINARYAELLAIASPNEADEIKTRYRIAASNDSWFIADGNIVFDEEILKAYNFDNNLITPDEMEHEVRFREKQESENEASSYWYKGPSNRFVKIVKSKEYAKELLSIQLLQEKPETAKRIKDSQWKQLNGMIPEPELVYEKLRGNVQTIADASYSFEYQHPDSITKHTGTGTVNVNGAYGEYEAEYICEKADDDLMQYVNGLEYCDFNEVPRNALIRAGIRPRKDDPEKTLSGRLRNTINAIVASNAKTFLRGEYGWNTYYIEVSTSRVNTVKEYERAVYVPYYYYIFEVDGDVITARINAFDGSISYFVNNKYGQIKPKLTKEEKASKKEAKKAGKKKKFKGWMIPLIVVGALALLFGSVIAREVLAELTGALGTV